MNPQLATAARARQIALNRNPALAHEIQKLERLHALLPAAAQRATYDVNTRLDKLLGTSTCLTVDVLNHHTLASAAGNVHSFSSYTGSRNYPKSFLGRVPPREIRRLLSENPKLIEVFRDALLKALRHRVEDFDVELTVPPISMTSVFRLRRDVPMLVATFKPKPVDPPQIVFDTVTDAFLSVDDAEKHARAAGRHVPAAITARADAASARYFEVTDGIPPPAHWQVQPSFVEEELHTVGKDLSQVRQAYDSLLK